MHFSTDDFLLLVQFLAQWVHCWLLAAAVHCTPCSVRTILYDCLRFAIGGFGAWWAFFSIPVLLLFPSASGFEETQNADVVTEEHEGLLANDAASQAVPIIKAEWTLRQEGVDS
ncbi:hypothetical protein F5148DRAFT_194882 [Russula earlei]|uniref:Uncharacterized protein n=1 Tax=Russula earlei TaxID=71964 RepID=A0ACC0U6I4_9AGAM|nr:hypothetical protein F5148DRAFT_194882 [Russula earlei]